MAPEQVEKPETVDHRADIFSLGVVFYEMLTGELPLGKFAPPSSRRVEVDVRLDEVVLRALEKETGAPLSACQPGETAVDTIAAEQPRRPRPRRRRTPRRWPRKFWHRITRWTSELPAPRLGAGAE